MSARMVRILSFLAAAHAMLWAMVEAPTPPRAPVTATNLQRSGPFGSCAARSIASIMPSRLSGETR